MKTSSKLNTLFQCVSPVIELPDKSLIDSQQQSATLLTSISASSPAIFTDNPLLHIDSSNKIKNDHKDLNVTTDEEDDEVQSVSTLCEE